MIPPTRLDHFPVKMNAKFKNQQQIQQCSKTGASVGLLHSAANQIIMMACGSPSIPFITPPYNSNPKSLLTGEPV